MTHEGLYIIIQAVNTLLNGTLVVVLCCGVLDWFPAPHEGLHCHYTKKHVLRVQVLFSVQYSTIQTSERLLNHNSLCRVVLGGSGVVVSDP